MSVITSEWSKRYEERAAIAATHDYAASAARRCADRPECDRMVSAFSALAAAVMDDTRTRDDLMVLATELDIACCFEPIL